MIDVYNDLYYDSVLVDVSDVYQTMMVWDESWLEKEQQKSDKICKFFHIRWQNYS